MLTGIVYGSVQTLSSKSDLRAQRSYRPRTASTAIPGIDQHGRSPDVQHAHPSTTFQLPPSQPVADRGIQSLPPAELPYVGTQSRFPESSISQYPFRHLESAGTQDLASHNAPALDLSRGPSPEPGGTGHYIGPTSAISWLQRVWRQLGQVNKEVTAHLNQDVVASGSIFTYGDRPTPVLTPPVGDLKLPSQDHTQGLLSRYFDFASPTYRYLHRPTISKWLKELHDAEDQLGGFKMTHARQAVVLMVLAHGSLYMSFSDGITGTCNAPGTDAEGERFFAMAQQKLSAEDGAPTIESVQARLIQCHYLLSSSRPNQAWFTFGTAVQLTLALGLYQKRTVLECTSPITRECQRRLFWAIYTSDKYISIAIGRPTLIQEQLISQDLPEPVNDEDLTSTAILMSGETDCMMDAPILHAQLAIIVGKASREQYSALQKSSSERLQLVAAHNHALEEWQSKLPVLLSGAVKASSLIPVFRRQFTALKSFYLHAVMLVNRPLLLSSFSRRTRHGTPENPAYQQSIQKCVDAAKAVAGMVLQLVAENEKFKVYWFTQYITFMALSILYLYVIQAKGSLGQLCKSQTEILTLAEKCQQHLAEATRSNAPGLRYSLILEELRQEVRRQVDNVTDATMERNISGAASGSSDPQGPRPHTDFSILEGPSPNMNVFDDVLSTSGGLGQFDLNLDFWPQLDSLPLCKFIRYSA
ncbi:uncharacterized protein PAC_02306 [Phialocephala subalpina]|uniref:Xylanolytic transcriptional activator regulatory domain-containing protein n=1 Tax=Phialocephala subalpina TaxID=576137 RepID=A0A1L7WI32_9HELO|nr:uncharacterized protein PAC_02306 [Phialocephala subalpina]